ncbi:MAG: hypothetical protein AAGB04_30595, partial [Pseudomonadota bacterium]
MWRREFTIGFRVHEKIGATGYTEAVWAWKSIPTSKTSTWNMSPLNKLGQYAPFGRRTPNRMLRTRLVAR